VTGIVCDQDDARAIDLTLHFLPFDFAATYDAGSASAWMGLVAPFHSGQGSLREPHAYLLPQLIL